MLVDLTHQINSDTPVYPGTEQAKLSDACTIAKDGFHETLLQFYSHTGTHIDAPAHIIPNGCALNSFTINWFCGNAIKIPLSNSSAPTPDSILNIINNVASKVDFILFNTNWDKYWGTDKYFNGFPTISIEVCKLLCSLKLKAIGFDTISVDAVGDENLPRHKKLLENNILIIENLTQLETLPDNPFLFFCPPLKSAAVDGGPVRAFAQL